jgi:hypothetical protein
MKILSILLLLAVISSPSHGGTIVGNGAGLVEGNFVFALRMLPQLLDSCLKEAECYQSSSDQAALQEILVVVKKGLKSPISKKIQFVSEVANPGFFTTAFNQTDRIAQTCLQSDCPIYINSDLLYSKREPALNYGMIVAVLVHEFGHQAGYKDHTYLDSLAANVRSLAESKHISYPYPLDSHIEIHQINNDFPIKYSELYLTKNGKVTRLTEYLMSFIREEKDWIGFELINGHYSFQEESTKQVQFLVWVRVYIKNDNHSVLEIKLLRFAVVVNQNTVSINKQDAIKQ